MKKLSSVAAGLAAGVALAVAAVAYAQPFGGFGPGYGPGMGMGPGHGPRAGFDPAAVVETRLAGVKAQLKITAEQETAWQGFADASKQQAASMQAARAQMWGSTGTAPELMAQRSQLMQQRAAGMQTVTSAFSALYAVLTPEQKAIADQNFAMVGYRGMPFARRAG